MSREDVGVFEAGVLTEVVPVAGAALGVDVEEDGPVPSLFREGGESRRTGWSCRCHPSAKAQRVQEA